jgi:hypothetical protein
MTNVTKADIEAEIDFLRTAADAEQDEADYYHRRALELREEANRLEKEVNG